MYIASINRSPMWEPPTILVPVLPQSFDQVNHTSLPNSFALGHDAPSGMNLPSC